ncbi:phosphoglycolate phosphatase [Roseibium marinum]|uniref:phosphoglycolate phosphatase n=1 Tax=Roseibium marinum TaxID=281252 RepID=A0A2S3V112_9HYPH|nr:phosphoglycolate phosphatase [Roseibium marinum]POF33654.1 phosphoglycolate phosphatase [Roseibium marinum]
MGTPIVIFDLDGTLIDSAPDIHAAASRLLKREGVPPLTFDDIRSFIGRGVPGLIDRIIEASQLAPESRERLIASFLDDYNARSTELTRVFPDVAPCLQKLREFGFRLGVCTNKPLASATRILKVYDLFDAFEAVVGGDSFPAVKPDPAGLVSLIGTLGGGPALYVGDSAIDAQTASRARTLFGLFTEGYLNARLESVRYTFRFDAFSELPLVTEEVFAHQGVFV